LPQWNCSCANCTAARQGKIPARTQSSIAISTDGAHWVLINASPDLRMQIDSFPALHPGGNFARNSPVCDVLLTNADLDHVLGLFLLRERSEKLVVHCTAAVRETLCGALHLDTLLGPYCGIEWRELPAMLTPLHIQGVPGDLAYRAIPLPGDAPRYAHGTISRGGQSVALEFVDEKRSVRLLVAPDVAEITPELQSALETADVVFFDGTFWSGDELRRMDPSARTASEMGHLPISGGSLDVLRGISARHRIYTHINNTNPIFSPGTPERAGVEAAGITVGEDGMEFLL
jgi:pyrroloquinoline quinone biosynthesis protein B